MPPIRPLLLLLLLLLGSSPAAAFPVRIPEFGSDGKPIETPPLELEYPIGVVAVTPSLLQVGDTFVFPFVLPSKADQHNDFTSYNKEMPDWLSATNTDALPMPVTGGESTDHAIIYTVVSEPPNIPGFTFEVFGKSQDQESFGPGDSRVLLIQCVPDFTPNENERSRPSPSLRLSPAPKRSQSRGPSNSSP